MVKKLYVHRNCESNSSQGRPHKVYISYAYFGWLDVCLQILMWRDVKMKSLGNKNREWEILGIDSNRIMKEMRKKAIEKVHRQTSTDIIIHTDKPEERERERKRYEKATSF